jgi:hypothetical protein
MGALIQNICSDLQVDRSKCESATCMPPLRCGYVSIGNRRGVTPALGHLALSYANGDDAFGYHLAATEYKTALLTTHGRAVQIRQKLLARQKANDPFKILTAEELLDHREEKLSRNQFIQRLDRELRDAEVVIVDAYELDKAHDQRIDGFAPSAYQDDVADYLIESASKRASTIFGGQGSSSGTFKRWDPKTTFDLEFSLYRFDSKGEPLSFLSHWRRFGGADMRVDELQISCCHKTSNGAYRWDIEFGVADSDPLVEFAIHLHRQGLTYQRIGDLLGRGRSTVHRWVTANRSVTPSNSR